MYDNTKTFKEQFQSLLSRYGVRFDADSQIFNTMEYLPEVNKRNILNGDYSKYVSFGDVYQAIGRDGLLRFIPYVNTEVDNPTLTVRHNVHIHLFRQRVFQASDTPTGIGTAETGSERIDQFLRFQYDEKEWAQCSLYFNMLCYAAFIDVAFHYQNVVDWFMSCTEEADRFVHSAYAFYGMHLKYTWKDIAAYVTTQANYRIDTLRPIYRIVSKLGTICEFAFGSETIQATTKANGTVSTLTLKLPNIAENIDDDEDIEYYIEDVQYTTVGSTAYRRDIVMLTTLALKLSSIHINWIGSYALGKLDVFPSTNAPGTTVVENLNEIYTREPDEY